MDNVNAPPADSATIVRLVQASKMAAAEGRTAESERLLAQAARAAPSHPAVLNELGTHMMKRGDAAKARELFERATRADPGHPALWSNLAAALHALELPQEEMAAVDQALAIDPKHLAALLQKATLIEAQGDLANAASVFRNALATLSGGPPPPQTVTELLEHARAVVRQDDANLAAVLEQQLASVRQRHPGAHPRLEKCLQLMTGRAKRYLPEPTFLYFPGLPAVEFFDNADFDWLAALESATPDIRAELTAVLVGDRAGLEPYIAYPQGVPLNQWKELNQSRRWSAYFLWNQGIPQEDHLARCPRTVAALRKTPQCDVAHHGPTAFFSILEAGTHIPPHTGVTNIRLTVHVPLIIPADCGFRVGSETREWHPGTALVFDDTIEHEAWNRSDSPRAVLIFDIWNPFLSVAERDLVRATVEAIGKHYNPGGA